MRLPSVRATVRPQRGGPMSLTVGAYTIDGLAAALGIPPSRIYYYRRKRIIPPPLGGYRQGGNSPWVWTQDHYDRLRLILRAEEERRIPLYERYALEPDA